MQRLYCRVYARVIKSTNQMLKELVCATLAAPENSPQRQQSLHRIYTNVMSSGKLWRKSNPYYGIVSLRSFLHSKPIFITGGSTKLFALLLS